jgi:hypothetical protein
VLDSANVASGKERAHAANSAGFANPGPDTAQRRPTPFTLGLGNWWEAPLGDGASDPLDW